MAYTIQGGNVQPRQVKLNSTDPTTIVPAGGATVVGIYAAEIAGSTPTFAIYKTDGTTNYYLRGAKAMTAHQEYERNLIVVLKTGESLVVQAGAADQIDVLVSYIPADKTAKG